MSNSVKLPTICELLKKFLKENQVRDSSIGKTLKKHKTFVALETALAIEKERKGPGWVWKMKKPEVINKYLSFECPNQNINEQKGERYNNIQIARNSKTRKRASYRLIFTRGKCKYTLNDEVFFDTSNDTVGRQLKSLQAQKICFVENLENFMENNELIQNGWVLIYVIGRIGSPILERVYSDEIMHFGDLDYEGLKEYARIKKLLPTATLYVPNNYFEGAHRAGAKITSKQIASDELLNLAITDEKVKKVLNFLYENNMYLEQEGYGDD